MKIYIIKQFNGYKDEILSIVTEEEKDNMIRYYKAAKLKHIHCEEHDLIGLFDKDKQKDVNIIYSIKEDNSDKICYFTDKDLAEKMQKRMNYISPETKPTIETIYTVTDPAQCTIPKFILAEVLTSVGNYENFTIRTTDDLVDVGLLTGYINSNKTPFCIDVCMLSYMVNKIEIRVSFLIDTKENESREELETRIKEKFKEYHKSKKFGTQLANKLSYLGDDKLKFLEEVNK